ncbi:S10 family peptidase [Bradyrhizobium sp. 2TAF24]|uniref:S10 family peptidase n=1 Tax=Bradyrhizobium sp. 2TAF24 TaxID=3233011 RepID=UPI003F8E7E7E
MPRAAHAQEATAAEAKAADSKAGEARAGDSRAGAPGVLALLPADAVTHHTLPLGDRPLAYTATAGTVPLYGQNGERTAAVFYTAYVAKDAPANRPITFVFNGGPGAASAYLHLGLVGPKILDFGPSGRDGAHAALIDNPQSWLAFTDLVIIDPVGTGWSRTVKADDAGFFGVQADAQVMAKVIALYLARNGRSGAPKYLLGESYGGFRAAKTAQALRQSQGLIVAGVIMLSPLIDGSLIFGSNRYALGAALQLPSLAATELERRGAFTPQALTEAERFAMTDYLTTLAGAAPAGDAARAFYDRVAALTGLSPDLVTRTRGFVRDAFLKHLRERDQAVVSIYDAALAAPDPYPDSDGRGPDPVLEGFTRAYGGAFAAYARDTLGFKTDMTYQLLSTEVNNKWKWGESEGSRRQANAADDIRELLSLDPSFRLLVAHGYSDLITPYGVSRYVLDHLPRELANGRTALRLYRGGHMLYTIPASRAAFTADAKAFYESDGRRD